MTFDPQSEPKLKIRSLALLRLMAEFDGEDPVGHKR